MDDLTVDGVVANFQSEYKTTPTTDVFNETYDQLCQVCASIRGEGGRLRVAPRIYLGGRGGRIESSPPHLMFCSCFSEFTGVL